MSLSQDVTVYLEQYIQNIQSVIRQSVEDHMVGIEPRAFRMKVDSMAQPERLIDVIRIALMFHQGGFKTAAFKQIEFHRTELCDLQPYTLIKSRFGDVDMTAAEMLGIVMGSPDFKEFHERVEKHVVNTDRWKSAASIAGQEFLNRFNDESIFKQLVEGKWEEK